MVGVKDGCGFQGCSSTYHIEGVNMPYRLLQKGPQSVFERETANFKTYQFLV